MQETWVSLLVRRAPREGTENPLQYSCLENPMDKGAWWAIVHGGCKESNMTQQLSRYINKTMHIIVVTFGSAGYSLLCKLFSSCGEQGLLYGKQASHCSGFSCCGAWSLPSSRAQQELWCLALVASLHMGSFRIRDQTHVSPALSRFLPLGHQGSPKKQYLPEV